MNEKTSSNKLPPPPPQNFRVKDFAGAFQTPLTSIASDHPHIIPSFMS